MSLAKNIRFSYVISFIRATFLPILLYSGINLYRANLEGMTDYQLWSFILSVAYVVLYLATFLFVLVASFKNDLTKVANDPKLETKLPKEENKSNVIVRMLREKNT